MAENLRPQCAKEALLDKPTCMADVFRMERIEIDTDMVACTGCFKAVFQRIKKERDIAQHEAATDFHTGLYNRRGLSRLIEQYVAEGKTPGLIQYDVTNFDLINNTWGHEFGDTVINQVRDSLSVKREVDALVDLGAPAPDDIVTRLGGDEFGILTDTTRVHIPGESPETQLIKAGFYFKDAFEGDRMIKGINAELWHMPGNPQVGLKFGICIYQPGDDINSMIKASDPKMHTVTERPA